MGTEMQNSVLRQYSDTANRAARIGRDYDLIVKDKSGEIRCETPVSPPGRWMKFKAAISHVPGLGSVGSLVRARKEVESYPVRVHDQVMSSKHLMQGLVKDMKEAYGSHITSMSIKAAGVLPSRIRGEAPVTSGQVNFMIATAENYASTNRAVTKFLEGGNAAAKPSLNRVLRDNNILAQNKEVASLSDAIGEPAARFVEHFVQRKCQEMTHGTKEATKQQIENSYKLAINLYSTIFNGIKTAHPKLFETQIREILSGVFKKAIEMKGASTVELAERSLSLAKDVRKQEIAADVARLRQLESESDMERLVALEAQLRG